MHRERSLQGLSQMWPQDTLLRVGCGQIRNRCRDQNLLQVCEVEMLLGICAFCLFLCRLPRLAHSRFPPMRHVKERFLL